MAAFYYCSVLLLCAAALMASAAKDGKSRVQLEELMAADDDFLENWMGKLLPVIENQTLLDLSLPGTHDSITYDLSTTISDGANDIPPIISWILHEFHDFAPGNFVRNQSKTQGLNVTEQLNNGVRFIDFRIMYSAPPAEASTDPHDWYCLHFMESNQPALAYLKEVRAWLDAHPTEILVFWFSRHGDQCDTEYPDVTEAEKIKFWDQVETVLSDVMFDTRTSQMNVTTVAELIQRNQRFVAYVSDVANFTEGSPFAQSGCKIDNRLGDDLTDEVNSYKQLIQQFSTANVSKQQDKANNTFYLQTMAASGPTKQIELAALIHYDPIERDKHRQECAAIFNIPNMTDFCPMTLQEISQLTNYYNQLLLDAIITQDLHLPNAIYLDALDQFGTIRTGTELFFPYHSAADRARMAAEGRQIAAVKDKEKKEMMIRGVKVPSSNSTIIYERAAVQAANALATAERDAKIRFVSNELIHEEQQQQQQTEQSHGQVATRPLSKRKRHALHMQAAASVGDHETTAFAYADTFLLYNVRNICRKMSPPVAECAVFDAFLVQRRADFPLSRWDDPAVGRLLHWPIA